MPFVQQNERSAFDEIGPFKFQLIEFQGVTSEILTPKAVTLTVVCNLLRLCPPFRYSNEFPAYRSSVVILGGRVDAPVTHDRRAYITFLRLKFGYIFASLVSRHLLRKFG